VKFLLGLVLGILVVPATIFWYFASGHAPVSTTDPDMPFEAYLARIARHSRVDRDMPRNVPIQPSEANYLVGADLYQHHCAVCHGLPDSPKTAIATGMFPHPPQLFHGKGVTDDEPGETYWKISNGIRLTGMPGFSKSLSQTQMWQMALLLADADKLPPSVKTALTVPPAPPNPPPANAPPASPKKPK